MVLTNTVADVQKVLAELDAQTTFLCSEVANIKQTVATLKDSIEDIKGMLDTLLARSPCQCSCGQVVPTNHSVNATPAPPAAEVSNALVPLPAAASNENPWISNDNSWNAWQPSGWAAWYQDANAGGPPGLRADVEESEEDLLKEIPFTKPYLMKPPFVCLYECK
jgi:hypothetical protein